MQPVGIIANPDSGKDIRRLVTPASVFDDREKINILKRLFMALEAMGVERVMVMPDPAGLARTALGDVAARLHTLEVSIPDLPAFNRDYRDSFLAARAMLDEDCACIITLGGDGTNRVVASAGGETPLLPVSAGTNNVFPFFIEATIAGLAAAAFARGAVDPDRCCRTRPRLDLLVNGNCSDMALIDVVVVDQQHTGTRAIWDPGVIRELYLTRARPGDIGLSSIGGCLHPMPEDSGTAMRIRTGDTGTCVMAPVAPGRIEPVTVSDCRLFGPEDTMPIDFSAGIIAVDGEREIIMTDEDRFEVRLNLHGPRVIDVDAALAEAVNTGFLRRPADG